MLHVGYTTPYRIVLLLLIKRLCTYDFPEDLMSTFVVFITKNILNESSIRETCSEPRLNHLLNEITKLKNGETDMQPIVTSIKNEIETINNPRAFDDFMTSLKELVVEDEETERPVSSEYIVLEKCSVMGLFVRRCKIEYAILPMDRMSDIVEAFDAYIHDRYGDSYLLPGGQPSDVKGWISVYNIKEFLKAEADKIELTGTSNIHPSVLYKYLENIEPKAPHISNIRQVRYLNYVRTKEYVQSLSDLHTFFDLTISEGVPVQYALLNIGILEFKFGHIFNALSALNDALSAARSDKDDYCLQEVEYWIGTCRKTEPFRDTKSFDDPYLANMRTLTKARDLLRQGEPCRLIFETLQTASVDVILKDVKNTSRVKNLIASLAWQRYGNSALAASYLKFAENSSDRAVQDIETSVVSHANMLQLMGNSNKALQVLQQFSEEFPTEADFLLHWKQAQSRIKKLSCKKRKFDAINDQVDKLRLLIPPYSEEYFDAIYENAKMLMANMEYAKALYILEEVHDFIKINEIQTAIRLAIDAMTLSKRTNDAKYYYKAAILLSEAYVRTNDKDLIQKALFILENIFPKVLLAQSLKLTSELQLTYAEALDSSSSTDKHILEYVNLAEKGFRTLKCKDLLLRALFFKITLLHKLDMPSVAITTMQEIRQVQSEV
ncbi:hypothetical protein INT47_001635 [Mucor saturninus]|uniref:Anaphase-promoting complex subunit 5 n=1 Tax=Mucor saturninus TaxID=64648 RepID=A0A8H7RJI0_9FUNG|nr:hypothetical protein INT47_001635 [Mucor saturninus]